MTKLLSKLGLSSLFKDNQHTQRKADLPVEALSGNEFEIGASRQLIKKYLSFRRTMSSVEDISAFNDFEKELKKYLLAADSFSSIFSKLKEDHDASLLEVMKSKPLPSRIMFDFNQVSLNANLLRSAAESFQENGLVVLQGALPEDVVKKISDDVDGLIEQCQPELEDRAFADKGLYAVDGGAEVKGYRTKANYPKTLVCQRMGADLGLVDIFNMDHALPGQAQQLHSTFHNEAVKQILANSFPSVEYDNLNIYYNNDVTDTRGFHVDSYEPKVKLFLYLTDVTIEKGPYSFTLGSQHSRKLLKHNRRARGFSKFKETDVLYVPQQESYAVCGRRGDLIISCQHAMHRGYPQESGSKRVMAVQSVKINP